MKYIYIIDTSSLIEMKDKYPEIIFPSIWKKMEELFEQERLIAPEEVKYELMDKELKKWIENKKEMFIKADKDQTEKQKEIIEKFPFLAKEGKTSNKNADPWIIALALTKRHEQTKKNRLSPSLFSSKKYLYTILTEESKTKQQRIPYVSKQYNLDCINLKELFQREKWKF